MKQLLILVSIFILSISNIEGQEMDIKQLPPQDMLGTAALFGNIEIIKLAISKGADINYEEKFPLCSAIYGANSPPGEDGLNYVGMLAATMGMTIPLREKYLEAIRWLLQNGAKATISSDYNEENIPLLCAAGYNDIEVIRLLLEFKTDPNSRSQSGQTALHIVGRPEAFPWPYRNAPEIAKLLISKGAKMFSDEYILSPLDLVKERLAIIEDSASPWKAYPFYDELVRANKSLIEIYSKR